MLPGVVGCIQATEVIKLLVGIGKPLIGRFMVYDALEMRFWEFKFKRNPQCALCGEQPTITDFIDYDHFAATGEVRSPQDGDGQDPMPPARLPRPRPRGGTASGGRSCSAQGCSI